MPPRPAGPCDVRRQLAAGADAAAGLTAFKSHTVLRSNEILTEITIPANGGRSATYEVRQKTALDWPLVAAAVTLKLDGKTIRSSRIVLGHVAPTPWAAPEAEEALNGKTLSEEVATRAGEAAVSRAQPLSQNRYKVQLARVAVKRAILQAARS